ncbi:Na+/H+ antiporter subunit E [Noviherbaspirillum massiliense]|uniref:Na+/H+ antiporter subunit E n=1 Tax=Noviherbaspirillum massiliense TaxID=1465823 RepID=UPI00030A0EE3|nr:Na+/H+ antiporter subunit E [Noviherbaspirillum massiliense]
MKRMRFPLLTAFLVLIWLLLNDTLAPGQIVLGLALAVALSAAVAAMRPLRARPRRLGVAIALLFRVLVDIVKSNIAVAGMILGGKERRAHAGFMEIPLDLRDPHGLAMLACIITATPGTVWSGLSPDGGTLRLHVLELLDEEAWVRTIKHRYERPLMEIFE